MVSVPQRGRGGQLWFQVGPVRPTGAVSAAMAEVPYSHRSEFFENEKARLQRRLEKLTHAEYARVVLGTGTLANEMVAFQIRSLSGQGLIVVNGEFGARLRDQAERIGLKFSVVEFPYGEGIDQRTLLEKAERRGGVTWLWAVHCETSTGVLNQIEVLKRVAKRVGAKLCLDCVSSLGNVDVSLRDVYIASGTANKGVGASPGIAVVFCERRLESDGSIPRYLDLGLYFEAFSPFTHSWNLVRAFHAGMDVVGKGSHIAKIERYTYQIREALEEGGFRCVASRKIGAPGVLTLDLSGRGNSMELGDALREEGVLVSYGSEYLRRQNWLQIGVMGEVELQDVAAFIGRFLDIARLYLS